MINNDRKMTILAIDDERDILVSIRDFFISEGHHVLTAENGLEALKLLEHCEMPDLILLDMKMPIMNGQTFLRELHGRYRHSNPIIVVTSAADAQQRAQEVRAQGWVNKPFMLEELIHEINRQLPHNN